jgi:hypothetical protein
MRDRFIAASGTALLLLALSCTAPYPEVNRQRLGSRSGSFGEFSRCTTLVAPPARRCSDSTGLTAVFHQDTLVAFVDAGVMPSPYPRDAWVEHWGPWTRERLGAPDSVSFRGDTAVWARWTRGGRHAWFARVHVRAVPDTSPYELGRGEYVLGMAWVRRYSIGSVLIAIAGFQDVPF